MLVRHTNINSLSQAHGPWGETRTKDSQWIHFKDSIYSIRALKHWCGFLRFTYDIQAGKKKKKTKKKKNDCYPSAHRMNSPGGKKTQSIIYISWMQVWVGVSLAYLWKSTLLREQKCMSISCHRINIIDIFTWGLPQGHKISHWLWAHR